VEDILKYFEAYRDVKNALGIVDDDVWNMNETGFRIGCDIPQWVITFEAVKALIMTDPDNRDYITSAEAISGGGLTTPPWLKEIYSTNGRKTTLTATCSLR